MVEAAGEKDWTLDVVVVVLNVVNCSKKVGVVKMIVVVAVGMSSPQRIPRTGTNMAMVVVPVGTNIPQFQQLVVVVEAVDTNRQFHMQVVCLSSSVVVVPVVVAVVVVDIVVVVDTDMTSSFYLVCEPECDLPTVLKENNKVFKLI